MCFKGKTFFDDQKKSYLLDNFNKNLLYLLQNRQQLNSLFNKSVQTFFQFGNLGYCL